MPKFKFKTEGKFAKNVMRNYVLVPHLDAYFTKDVRGFSMTMDGKEGDLGWHPSGDCTPGVIELYNSAQDRLDGIPSISKFSKAFPVGHFWHALCQHAVVDLGLAEQQAIERKGFKGWGHPSGKTFKGLTYKPFHYATGSADVAPLTVDGKEYLVDFKTMSNQQYGKDNTPIPAWIAEKYEAQINIYLDFFDMDTGLIVAIQKDTPHNMKEFTFKRNDALVTAIYDKWAFVSECLDAEEPPTQQDEDAFSLNGLFEGPIEE